MYVGKKIRQLRNKLDLTQNEFAIQLGISQAYYSDIERGKKPISGRILEKINKKWNIDPSYFSRVESENISQINSKNDVGVNVGVNVGVEALQKPHLEKNNSFRLFALMKGKSPFLIDNAEPETINIDSTLNTFFSVSMVSEHIIEHYLSPLWEISETKDIDYKEFIKKYFERLNSYKPYSKTFSDFIEAFNKFCKEMHDLGDDFF